MMTSIATSGSELCEGCSLTQQTWYCGPLGCISNCFQWSFHRLSPSHDSCQTQQPRTKQYMSRDELGTPILYLPHCVCEDIALPRRCATRLPSQTKQHSYYAEFSMCPQFKASSTLGALPVMVPDRERDDQSISNWLKLAELLRRLPTKLGVRVSLSVTVWQEAQH